MLEALRIRVAFADTDAMGVAYHGNYLRWLEMGRVELLRATGITYRDLVERDVHLPVVEACVRYYRPARFDEELSVWVELREQKGVRLRMAYLVKKDAEVVASGHTDHVFTDSRGRVIRPPADVAALLARIKEDKE